MLKIKTLAAMLAATPLFSTISIVPNVASAEELDTDTDITEEVVSGYEISGTATKGVGNVWYVEKSGNIFTDSWEQYWYFDGQAGVGEISYNDFWETDRVCVLHNSATHCGYVQNRSSMTGAWTNYADSGKWTNTASISHGSGTIRWWFYN